MENLWPLVSLDELMTFKEMITRSPHGYPQCPQQQNKYYIKFCNAKSHLPAVLIFSGLITQRGRPQVAYGVQIPRSPWDKGSDSALEFRT